ncbi:Rrf2 family transcriptional regulator [Rhodopila sp.]|jgi:Rrf2 family nitric oxide-sensitive transcriptional repressor|uniref:Rrf2 family transcriptional regulator n=1 Tax=Rhodopila sp. TaxID=2480087 RepID=UPI002CFB6990|nr:Rrf2 family transcriptional regulator [Rhodopila sp.]HVZ06693.1 Rrf2 family transcriptional regulator [Rhodopila sp.]
MRLTAFSDYSLRTLIYLAVRGQSTIAEVSRVYGISETHLNKVIHQLGIAGEIETVRGRGGGIRLARPPAAINVGAVVRRTEDFALVPCLEGAVCLIAPACMLQTALKEAMAAFLAVLDRYTIADLVSSPALAGLLEVA